MAIEFISGSEVESKINKEGVTLVNLFADWCGPCKMLANVLTELEAEGNVKVLKINVDTNQEYAQAKGVRGIPATFVYKDGKEVGMINGFMPIEILKSKIESS